MTTSTKATVTPGRLRCLQALAFGKLGLTTDEKDQLVEKVCPGKRRFHELTNAEADQLIDRMKMLAGQPPTKPQPRDRGRARRGAGTGDIALLITPGQRERLAELTRELIAAGLRPGYIEHVRLRACGEPFPRTAQQAEKAIEAQKDLLERVRGGWRPGEPA